MVRCSQVRSNQHGRVGWNSNGIAVQVRERCGHGLRRIHSIDRLLEEGRRHHGILIFVDSLFRLICRTTTSGSIGRALALIISGRSNAQLLFLRLESAFGRLAIIDLLLQRIHRLPHGLGNVSRHLQCRRLGESNHHVGILHIVLGI